VYNVLSTAVDVDDLMGLLAALPGEKLAEALYDDSTSFGLLLKLKCAVRGLEYWRTVLDFYRTKRLAEDVAEQYRRYPSRPDALATWQERRDDLMDRVYETVGAEPKY
jgi:hypothetical protein